MHSHDIVTRVWQRYIPQLGRTTDRQARYGLNGAARVAAASAAVLAASARELEICYEMYDVVTHFET